MQLNLQVWGLFHLKPESHRRAHTWLFVSPGLSTNPWCYRSDAWLEIESWTIWLPLVKSSVYVVKHPFTEPKGNPGLSKIFQDINEHQNFCLSAASDNPLFTWHLGCVFLALLLKWCSYSWWCQLRRKKQWISASVTFYDPCWNEAEELVKNGMPFGWRLLQSIWFLFLHNIAEKGPSLALTVWALSPWLLWVVLGEGATTETSGMQRGDRERKTNSIYL